MNETADWGDVIVLLGMVMLLAGLFLFDWRAALVGGGVILMLAGSARLRTRGGGR